MRPSLHYLILSTGLLIGLLTALTAQAAVIEAELPITAVTVHPRTAVITRTDEIDLPAGNHQLVINGLPQNLDPSRLQLAIADDNVRLGSLEVTQAHTGDLVTERERQLREALQALKDTRREITDGIDSAKTELQLLTSIASGGDQGAVKPTVNSNELASLISTIGEGSEAARRRIRESEVSLRELDKEIEQKQFELDQVATNRVVRSLATAQLQMAEAVTASVAITYPENNAGWRWLYEARLNTETSELGFFRQASVTQGTGDDWTNVALTLTTADPRRGASTPQLRPIFVDIQRQQELAEEVVVTARKMEAGSERFTTDAAAPAPAFEPAQINATQYLVEFDIPGRTTVQANRQDKVLPIDNKTFEVDLVTRTVPSRALSAFLEAKFTYEEDTPLQAGQVQLYRDNAFIGRTTSNAFLPNEEIRLPFGVDERIRVAVQPEEEESRDGGVLRRTSVKEERQRYEITSYHAQPVTVEVVGQIPVSRNKDIKVEIADEATPATDTEIDGKAGLLLWELQAAPQETVAIKHYYRITYPKDESLEYR